MSIRKIATGAALVSSATLFRVLLQFISIPILSRLLSPDDYGLIGIAMPFISFAMLITDAGIGMSLVRSSPLDQHEAWSTSFWLIAALGFGLALLLGCGSPLAARAFDEPRLTPIVIVLACTIFAQSLTVIPGAALQQTQRFRTIAALEIASVMAGLATALVTGFLGAGVWALVLQQVVFFSVRTIGTFTLSPFRPRFVFILSQIRHHLTFGRDIVSVNTIAHVSNSLDNLVIGNVLGPTSVGLYAMAMQFIRLPTIVITGPLQFVLYSHLAKIKDDLPAIRRMFLLVTRLLTILVLPPVGMVAAAHTSIFEILLSDKWSQSSTIFMILAPAGAAQAMMALGADIMLVLGRSDLRLRTTVEFGLIWLGVLLLSVSYGTTWVAVAYSCAVPLYVPRMLRLILALIDCRLRSYLEVIAAPVLSTLTAVCLHAGFAALLSPTKYAECGIAIGLALATMAFCAALQFRSIASESLSMDFLFRSRQALP